MTTCNAGNLCWIADKSEICPCSAVLPLILIILGLISIIYIFLLIIKKYKKALNVGDSEE